jgi:hypothetical protein
MGLFVLLVFPAFAWPSDAEWSDLSRSGAPLGDPAEPDVASDLDLVGDSSAAVLAWTADEEALWLRIRFVGPLDLAGGELASGDRGVLIELDGDEVFDVLLTASGPDGALRGQTNVGGQAGTAAGFDTWGAPVEFGDRTSGAVRVEGAQLDLRVPRERLAELGLPDDAPLRLVPVAGPSRFLPWSDLGGCEGLPSTCAAIGPIAPGPVSVDADLDGRTDPLERTTGTSRTDSDTDDDGLLDGDEPVTDTDGDGFEDARDCDSDGDGVRDGVEVGLTAADVGPGTDTGSACFRSDADPAGPPTDPRWADTDGGGLADGVEDWNRDGAFGPWETDPNDPADDLDTDADGVADVLELLGADASVDDLDSDGDGVPDAVERLSDPDADGIPAFLDDDSDGDGVLDASEGEADTDGDGVRDLFDLDADGDGVPDAVEGDVDSDGDGNPDLRDLDSDGDGARDVFEGTGDFDGDGVPDRLDLDSDDDGILDEDEGERDADTDGVRNAWESDSDGDGIPDGVEGPEDVDADGLANFEDRNADGTGSSDATEGRGDVDCDGIPNYLDRDDEDAFCDPTQGDPAVGPAVDVPADPPAPDGSGAWSGCSTVGGPAVGWLVLLLVAAAGRRAGAQEVDAQRFRPAVDGTSFALVQDLQMPEHIAVTAGIWGGRAVAPLGIRGPGGYSSVVDHVSTAQLGLAVSGGRGRLTFDLPVHGVVGAVDGRIHVGDARLVGVARAAEVGSLRVGGLADVVLPTGDRGAWVSSGRVRSRFGAVLDGGFERWVVAADLGVRTGSGQALGLLELGPALFASAGVAWPADGPVSASLELDGELGLRGGSGGSPAEWLASARVEPRAGWTLVAAGGTGLTRGVGAPSVRVLAGIRYTGVRRPLAEEFRSVQEGTPEP